MVSGSIVYRPFNLFVVPAAQRAFSDGAGSTMVLWEGATSALDSPLLIVEGIDADNVNVESHYYALGSDLFGIGRTRGADVLILDFDDGGADMRLNAAVVGSAIQYVNQIKTGSRKLDVAGVSMGGVIARYALAEMEQDGVEHNVGRFVSLDGPQQGAVMDRELLNWLHDPPWYTFGNIGVPANITSTAGKQLLQYNPFDTASPSLHNQFFDELGVLNGDGYPHQTVENVGVSFGSSALNPNAGQEWLEIEIEGALPNHHFHIETGSDEAGAGSFLPREITMIGGLVPIKVFSIEYNLERKSDPTFIPYNSALDLVNGQTQFDAPAISANLPRFHNEVPPEIIEPLLTRLGYPPAPLNAVISGPTSIPSGTSGTWTSISSGGDTPYSYVWTYQYPCDGNGGDELGGEALPAGEQPGGGGTYKETGCLWYTGSTGSSFTKTFSGTTATIKLRVTDAAGAVSTVTRVVTLTSNAQGGEQTATAGTESAAMAATAESEAAAGEPVLTGVRPNPFNPATVVQFSLPEALQARIAVYDMLGREVALLTDARLDAGLHEVRFDASALPSGVYLVRMVAGAHVSTERITLLK